MKTMIVLSDSHGNAKGIEKLNSLFAENNYIVHLGDGEGDMRKVRSEYPDKTYVCRGNCDFFSPIPEDGEIEVENVKIYYCHGHRYGVKSQLTRLAEEAKRRDCDIALYGHTHNARIDEINGVTLINPGSLRRAVGEGGSYCYLVINKDKFTPVIVGESVF